MYKGGARILVVDDNLAFARVEEFNVRRAGYIVTTAVNGEEALELTRGEEFDLIVTDHQMPRMSGIDFCWEVRTLPQYAAVPIVFCTGKAFELDGAGLEIELSPARVLKKPISMNALIALIGELLSPPAVAGNADGAITI